MMAWYLGVALVSAGILAYEIILIRMLSITLWYHFAYMIISIALLGFGASGTFIALFQGKLRKRLAEWAGLFALLFAFASAACFGLSQRVPFEPNLLPWLPEQPGHLVKLYLLLVVPFFFGATCIGLSFLAARERMGRMYGANLLGSAVGSLGAVLLLYLFPPERTLVVISGLGLLALVCWAATQRRRVMALAAVLAVLGVFTLWQVNIKLRISPYKQLSYRRNLSDAKTLAKRFSPLGRIDVIQTEAFRYAPCSLAYTGTIPPQLDLIIDADSESPITNFGGDWSRLDYLDYTTSALPYHLLESPNVLVVGAGGGAQVLSALYHEANRVDALELDPQVLKLVKEDFGEFACHIYRDLRVRPIIAEGRGYVESTSETYDLIDIALLDSYSSAAGGVHALSENYLYTVESLCAFIKKLTPGGILAITRWIKTPARDNVKMFATAVEALESLDIDEPQHYLIAVRTWRTATLLVSSAPFSPVQVDQARQFCRTRSIDFIHHPGIEPEGLSQFHQDEIYLPAAQEILFGDREGLYRDYVFNVRPATDDKPYFFHFFKLSTLHRLLSEFGRNAVPFVEWGYIILLATLTQAVVAGLVLIMIPLLFLSLRGQRKARGKVFVYFASLGLAFMFLEMAFIQKFILFLAYPVYVAAVVLTGFLLFAGLGSLCSLRIMRKLGSVLPVAAIIALVAIGYIFALGPVFARAMGLPDWLKIVMSLALIAPLAFFMGVPFPHGLAWVHTNAPLLVPWAWGVNGYFSVVAATLAVVLAMKVGFTGVVLCALGCYFLAAWCLRGERI